MRQTHDRTNLLLLAIALLFHVVGIVGIGIVHAPALLRSTPLHLLLMAGLMIVSFRKTIRVFATWTLTTAIVCFGAEWIGVHYGWLFGGYAYSTVLGPKWLDIPLVIGINWALVAAGAVSIAEGIAGYLQAERQGLKSLAIISRRPYGTRPDRGQVNGWLIVIVAATLATGYDVLLEPVAIRLGYWYWAGGRVPAYNYFCWWVLSAGAAALWIKLRLRGNFFAAVLFLLQLFFFIALRILL